MARNCILLLGLWFLFGCTTKRQPSQGDGSTAQAAGMPAFMGLEDVRVVLGSLVAPARDSPPPSVGTVLIPVYYATDRAATGLPQPDRFYGTNRGQLQFGVVKVTVPKRINPGVLSVTVGGYRLDLSADNTQDVIVRSIEPAEYTVWASTVRTALARSTGEDALVYVHGFHEQFDAAMSRAAQLAYYLNFRGLSFAFSWPTTGSMSVTGYMADEEMTSLAAVDLRTVLTRLIEGTGVSRVHVIAHSMGARVVAEALRDFNDTTKLGNVILAAPDVRVEVFSEQHAPLIRGRSSRLTLYASSRDRALQMSQSLHRAQRAGQSRPIVVLDSMDTVDASDVNTDLIGHGYFSDNKQVMDDLFMLTRFNAAARDRNLRPEPLGQRWYYILK